MQKSEISNTWYERIPQLKQWLCVLGSFSRHIPITKRAINNWPWPWAQPIAPFANGVGGGSKPISLLMRPAVERRDVFPLRFARKSPPLPVACPSRNTSHSRVGAGLNWLDAWPRTLLFLVSRPVPWGAGRTLSACLPSVTAAGDITVT